MKRSISEPTFICVVIEVSSDKCMIARQKAADRKRSTDNATKSGRQLSNDTGALITTHKRMAETEDGAWIEITDEMMKKIGFQGIKKYLKHRHNLFRHIRKHFKKYKDLIYAVMSGSSSRKIKITE